MNPTPANFIPKALLELEQAPRRFMPPAYHVMLKPSGPICNLDCAYCFYLRKEDLYEAPSEPGGVRPAALAGKALRFRMTDDVLEAFTRQYIQSQRAPEITFGWQGGEPTLMGLDFFRKAVALQQKYRKPGTQIINALQTNGVLLDDDWCRFFHDHGFLIGLSLDGPQDLHDTYRVDKGGKPTFDKVYRALQRLQEYHVEVNCLCVVNRVNADHPQRVYDFFRQEGVEFLQFIPVVERTPEGGVTEWTPRPEQWGAFLCGVFDNWVRQDVGRIFVQHFDTALQAWVGLEPSLCVHAKTCGNCLAMEHNGDLFACDHFVTPDDYLGNITQTPIEDLVSSPYQRRFGQDKSATLPNQCRRCPVRFACNGGCPKDRFLHTRDGEPGLNYLCAGYYKFFTHVKPYMETMADLLNRGYPPAAIMDLLREGRGKRETEGIGKREKGKEGSVSAQGKVGRNDPCPCGSGKKYKNCCLR